MLSWILAEPYLRQAFDPKDEGLAGIQWDSAELFQVCVPYTSSTIALTDWWFCSLKPRQPISK